MEKKPFDTLLTKKYLDVSASREKKTIKFFKEVICSYYGKPIDYLDTRSRKHEFVKIRQVCFYLMRKLLDVSYQRIADEFDRDHATIIYSFKLLEGYLEYDKELQKEIKELESILTLKAKAENFGIDLNGDCYFVDMNECNSVKLSKDKAIIFVGFNEDELNNIKVVDKDNFIWLDDSNEFRKHINTAMYILEQKQINSKEDDNEIQN